jgi:hypothetical protein
LNSPLPHHRMHSDPPDRIESAKRTAGNSVLLQRNRPFPVIRTAYLGSLSAAAGSGDAVG